MARDLGYSHCENLANIVDNPVDEEGNAYPIVYDGSGGECTGDE